MAGRNIGLRLTVDASQAKEQIESYSESLSKMNAKLMEAQESGDWSSAARMTQAIDNLTSAQKQQLALSNMLARHGGSIAAGGSGGLQIGSNLVAGANTASGAVSTLASGNYAGAAINATRGAGSSLRSIGKEVGEKEGLSSLGGLLGGLGIATLIAGAVGAAGNELSKKYEEALPYMANFNKLFLGVGTDRTGQEMHWYNRAAEAAEGTGLSTIEMLEAAKDEARYGMRKGENEAQTGKEVIDAARKAALMSYATGADLATVQNFQGTMRRYGGETNTLTTSHAALLATGMQEAQYEEFLNSLQKAVEAGIESGYTKSTEEVAANLTMFARLTGENPLWQGEQGIKRLIQLESRFSGATALQSTSDVMLATAAQEVLKGIDPESKDYERLTGKKAGDWTGSYVDTMLMMEKGISPELVKSLFSTVKAMEGGNVEGQIEQYMKLLGLNYQGAVDIYEMSKQAGQEMSYEEISELVKSYQANKEYRSNETKMQDTLNELSQAVVGFGQKAFKVKVAGIGNVEKITEKIFQYLIGKDKPIFEDFFDKKEGEVGITFKSYQEDLETAWRKNPAIFAGFNDWYYDLSVEEKKKINESDVFNTRDLQKFVTAWHGIKSAGSVDKYLESHRRSAGMSGAEEGVLQKMLDSEFAGKAKASKITMLRGLLYEDGGEQDSVDEKILRKLGGMFDSIGEYEAFFKSKYFDELSEQYFLAFSEGQKGADSVDPSAIEQIFNNIMQEFKKTEKTAIDANMVSELKGLRDDLKNLVIYLG